MGALADSLRAGAQTGAPPDAAPAAAAAPDAAPPASLSESLRLGASGKLPPTPSNDDEPGWRDYVGSLGASMSHAAMTSIPRLAEGAANLSAGIMSKITGHEYPGVGHPVSGAIESGINAAIPPPPEKNYGEHLINQFGTGAGDIAGPALLTKALGAAEVLGPKAADIAQKITGPVTPTNIAAGGLANVAGNEAANQKMIPIPEFAKPTVATVAGLAGGLVGAAPEIALNAGKAAASRVLPSVTRDAGELAAGQRMVREATDPNAALENLRNGGSTIPDVKLTTGQQSADPGLAAAEMAVRDQKNKGEFVQRAQEQNEALTNHLNSMQPKGANASPADVAAHFREVRNAQDAMHVAAVDTATSKAETAAGAVAPTTTEPEEIGQNLREPLATAQARAKDLTNQLYAEVERHGDVNIPSKSIADAAENIMGPRVPESKPVTSEEGRIFDLAREYGDATPLANVRALRSSITDEMANTRRTDPQTYGRLTALLRAVDDSMDQGIEGKLSAEPETAAKIQSIVANHFEKAQAEHGIAVGEGTPGVVETGARANAGRGSAGAAGQNRAAGPVASGSYPPPHGTGIPEGPAPKVRFTGEQAAAATRGRDQGLSYRIDREHDIPDLAGTSTNKDNKVVYIDHRAPEAIPLTNKNTGQVDQVAPDPFLAIHERAERELQATGLGQELAHIRATIVEHQALRDAGYDPAEYEKAMGAAWKVADHPPRPGRSPTDLFEKGDYTSRQIKEIKAAEPSPTVSENAPKAIEAARAAAASHKETQSTFGPRSGAPGKVLEKQPRGTGYLVSDASVAKKIFHPGDTGGEDVRAYLKASGDPKALEDAVSYSFSQAAMKDGKVIPAKSDKWIADHKTALDELPPAVRAKFQNAATAQRTVETAITTQHAAQVAADKSALAKVSGLNTDEEVSKKIGSIMVNKTTGAKDLEEMANAVKGNVAAESGLQRAVAESIIDKFSNSSKVGAGETAELSRAKLSNFFKDNTPMLEKVLTPEQVGKLRAVITEMNRVNRTVTATKSNPGGPNTAQRLTQQEPKSVFGHAAEAFGAIAGEHIGEHLVGGIAGTVAGAAGGAYLGKVISVLKELGVRNERQIAVEIAMNPKKGAEVMSRAMYYKPEDIKGKIMDLFGTALRGAGETGMRQTGK